MQERSWLFRSVGWGHGSLTWKQIISALRLAGYDHVVSIEHEDALLSIDEGVEAAVELLAPIVLSDPPAEPWWT
jgi:sugar phosphate isomerase/epimerase